MIRVATVPVFYESVCLIHWMPDGDPFYDKNLSLRFSLLLNTVRTPVNLIPVGFRRRQTMTARLKASRALLGFCLLMAASKPSMAQLGEFFRPVPPPPAADTARLIRAAQRVFRGNLGPLAALGSNSVLTAMLERADGTTETAWRPVVNLPALKLTESVRPDAQVDGQVLTSVGGGISVQRLRWNSNKGDEGGWVSTFSFSPLTILVSGNFGGDDARLDVSPAMTIGFFDNVIMFGGGWDLGKVTGRSRAFGLLSIGINFNN